MKNKKPTEVPHELDTLIALANKKFGEGLLSVGESNCSISIPRISTRSLSIDYITNGGFPMGRMVEIMGPASSGKTTLALHVVAEAQSKGWQAAYLDIEHSIDPQYSEALGVDMSTVLFSQPDSGEQALDIVEMLVRSGLVKVIVVDSVAALVPQTEIEGAMGDQQMGLQARLMSKACRKLAPIVEQTGTLLLWINQYRQKIGGYGGGDVASGGNALSYYTTQRIDIRRIDYIKKGDQIVGNEIRVKVLKNKVGPPFRIAEVRILYGHGIDWATDLLRIAVTNDIIQKSGAWYSFGEERLGQGEGNTAELIRGNEELKGKLLSLITSGEFNEIKEEDSINSDVE